MSGDDLTLFVFLSDYANFLLSVTSIAALLYAVFLGRRMIDVMHKNTERKQVLNEREFASRYSDERLDLERKISDLNLQMMRSQQRFEEVNHLVIDGQKRLSEFSSTAINPQRFLNGISLDSNDLKIDKNLVFVLTPFHPSEERTFAAIVEGFKDFGVRVVRGDESSIDGAILTHIIEQIAQARFIVANVSTRNPNVMYELGIAHALGKDVIMISNSMDEMPFDIKSKRILFYRDYDDLVRKLGSEVVRKAFDQA